MTDRIAETTDYWQPLVRTGPRPAGARPLAGGWTWIDDLLLRRRGAAPERVALDDAPTDVVDRLTAPRAAVAGLTMDAPRVMAILNTTPDSFSDGGRHGEGTAALDAARRLIAEGAEILDIGGESTRPGAEAVPEATEEARVVPLIAAVRAEWPGAISIDTRKAPVAAAAHHAGATMLNDVSAMTYDGLMAETAAATGLPICLMHAQGDPATMQSAPAYDDVLLDVYDHLARRIAAAEAAGLPCDRVVIDPGIGFGKTLDHNLTLLRNLALFHSLGCPVLLGVSRKGLVGTLTGVTQAGDRMPGSVAMALAAVAQGVQILRVHDTAATVQALSAFQAVISEAH